MANITIYPYGQQATSPAEGSSLSLSAKEAIVSTLTKVAWADTNGESYLENLEEELGITNSE
ncbi:MAG: hypothetical protein J6U51_07805 [Bacteroidales bacterium]|nr:hypothetical protein [Bacteroidales bacterium]